MLQVGLLKGLVAVSESPPDPESSEFVDMRLLRAPKSYACRLYVVKGLHLQPKDMNGLADPYLRCKVEMGNGFCLSVGRQEWVHACALVCSGVMA